MFLLRQRLDAEKETFLSNESFRLHGMNGRQIHRLLARMTEFVETRSGLPSHYGDYPKRGGKGGYEIEHIWADQSRLPAFPRAERPSFQAHRQFRKADLDDRQNLYGRLADYIWSPARLDEAVALGVTGWGEGDPGAWRGRCGGLAPAFPASGTLSVGVVRLHVDVLERRHHRVDEGISSVRSAAL